MSWRDLRLSRVPNPPEVAYLARKVREAWGVGPVSRFDVESVCERLDIDFAVVRLGVPEGGAQGFLVPRAGGRFYLEVDPEPPTGWRSVSPGLKQPLKRHRKRFLIAHELAHTLFYDRRDVRVAPRRLVFDSARQEAFCDELARALLVPPEIAAGLPLTAAGVLEIQRRFDVSIELALRSATAAHPGAGPTWLLLRRGQETLIQWTSASSARAATALDALRVLAERARRLGTAIAPVGNGMHRAEAHFMRERDQVIVTPLT